MKNKGFTLIELLAVIIVIAIIAVIIIPRVNDAIETSKKGAAQTSALNYINAVDTYSMNKKLNKENMSLEGTYNVNENGELYNVTDTYEIEYTGGKIQNGEITYSNDEFSLGCLTINGYKVNINERKETTVEKGECDISVGGFTIPYSFTREVNGVSYASATDIKANPIYYNPESASLCTKSLYDANMEASEGSAYPKTGCLKWYAYSYENGKANMILAHNTTAKIDGWVKDSTDYADGASVGISYDTAIPSKLKSYSGPVTVLKQLKADTNSWSNELLRNDTYSATITDEEAYTYTINYGETRNASEEVVSTAYKARLITAEEIAAIANKSSWTIGSNAFYLQNGSGTVPTYTEGETSDYSWLYDYTNECTGGITEYGCTVTADSANLTGGYWTSSPGIHNYYGVITVVRNGELGNTYITNKDFGVRPVITVPASVVLS